MKKIKIGFSKPKNHIFPIFSWGIRLFQGWTDYSHVYLKFHSDSLDKDIIYQASGLQVNFVGNELFSKHVHIIKEFEIEIDDNDYINLLQFAVDNAGKPYSIIDIIAILFNKPKLLDGNKKYICSELIATILAKYYLMTGNKSYGMYTPKDIYNFLDSLNL